MSPGQVALAALRQGCGDLLAYLMFGPVTWAEIARAGLIGQAETAGCCGLAASVAHGPDTADLEVLITAEGRAVVAGLFPEPAPVAVVAAVAS